MFHVCFGFLVFLGGFWGIFLSESLKAQRTRRDAEGRGGLSESLKAQRTLKTLKEEGLAPEGRKVYS